MATVFAQNVIEIAIDAAVAGRPHVNVLHVVNDEGAQSDATKARDVLNNWQDHIMPVLASPYVLNGARWRSLDPDDTNAGTLEPDPGKAVGGVASGGPILPPSSCYLVKKVTQTRPRGRRDGRMFLSGVPEVNVGNDGRLVPAELASLQVLLDYFVDGVNDDAWGVGGGSGLVVLETTVASRAPGSQSVTINSRPVTSLALDSVIGHQRDRVR